MDDRKLAAVLSDFARTMVTEFPIQAILDRLIESIVEVLPVSAAGVTLVSPGTTPHYVAASDRSALRFVQLQTSLRQGPCVLAYESGNAVEIPDLRAETRFPQFTRVALAAGLAAVFTFPLRHGDGRLGALDLYRETAGPLDPAGVAAAQTLADVTSAYLINATAREEARVMSDRFRQNSLQDALTGLPNRALLLERLEHAAQRARRSHRNAAVLFADLDRFKAVNDTYGHHVGDQLLVGVAERLGRLVRPGDTLARVSGDEFVILCEDMDSAADVEALAERIVGAFAEPFALPSRELVVTASVGIAFAGPGEAISEQLVVDADIAMYQAKRNGGASHQVVDLREATELTRQDRLAAAFRAAFAAEALDLEYQPIVAVSDGSVTGVEALLRWTDADEGPIPTPHMIGLAERHGLMREVGAWVLDRACRDHARWHQEHPTEPLVLAVNVTAGELLHPAYCETVAAILVRTGMDAGALTLELTEDVFTADADRAMTVLADLKDLGIQLALDNFGTGYSSLTYLRQFPVDILKIDRSFIAELGHAAGDAVLAAMVELAHALELRVIVARVETAGQAAAVRAVQCEGAQGFHFAHPTPADGVSALLAERGTLRLPATSMAQG